MDHPRNLRVALYSRVSTKKQAESGFSLEAQREALRSYALEHGHQVIAEVEEVGSASEFQRSPRPEWSRVLGLAENGAIDAICVTFFDRATRGDTTLSDLRAIGGLMLICIYETTTEVLGPRPPGFTAWEQLRLPGIIAEYGERDLYAIQYMALLDAYESGMRFGQKLRQPISYKRPDDITLLEDQPLIIRF